MEVVVHIESEREELKSVMADCGENECEAE